jgi:hypothetical protein
MSAACRLRRSVAPPIKMAAVTDPLPAIDPGRAALRMMTTSRASSSRLSDPKPLLARRGPSDRARQAPRRPDRYVRVALEDADFAAAASTSMMAKRVAAAGRALHADSPATQVHDAVAPQEGDIIVRKSGRRLLEDRSRRAAAGGKRSHLPSASGHPRSRPALQALLEIFREGCHSVSRMDGR